MLGDGVLLLSGVGRSEGLLLREEGPCAAGAEFRSEQVAHRSQIGAMVAVDVRRRYGRRGRQAAASCWRAVLLSITPIRPAAALHLAALRWLRLPVRAHHGGILAR